MAIPVALKKRAMKRAMTWLRAPPDEYTEAWHYFVHPDTDQSPSCCHISPLQRAKRQAAQAYKKTSTVSWGKELMCEELASQHEPDERWAAEVKRITADELHSLSFFWSNKQISSSRTSERRPPSDHITSELHRFWPNFRWLENVWIVDVEGNRFKRKEYAYFDDCDIGQIHLKRVTRLEYASTPPCRPDKWTAIRLRKRIQAMYSIVICSPELLFGEILILGRSKS